jgi:bacterioferritin-associated ferredoxin
MYICLCNALTDEDVRQAALAGAECPGEVQRACGGQQQCGTCSGDIQQIIDETCPHHARVNAPIPE